MVLVMESDGSLTAMQSQNSFARNYNDGVGQGSAADALAQRQRATSASIRETPCKTLMDPPATSR